MERLCFRGLLVAVLIAADLFALPREDVSLKTPSKTDAIDKMR
jgi:hypothetical protein